MLQLQIDGRWEPQDFAEVFEALEGLYYKLEYFGLYKPHANFFLLKEFYPWREPRGPSRSFAESLSWMSRRFLDRARYMAEDHYRLKIARVQYASPGGIDLVGIGKVFGSIERMMMTAIRFYSERDLRRERIAQAQIETERKRIDLEKDRETLRAMQIENAREAFTLLRDFPEHESVLLPLAVKDQEALADRVAQGKIISVRRSDLDRDVDAPE